LQAELDRHDYPDRVQTLLGELMAAAVLLASTLKFEGSLTLQARGNGPLETLMAECNHLGEVRAIAQVGEAWDADTATLPLPELLGDSQLSITIDPEDGQRYQGIVPLNGLNLAQCIEHYFAQSEQLPTRLWLACEGEQAGGLLLQVLPGHDDEQDRDQWPRLQQLSDTVRPNELASLPAEELLYRLYHEETVELFAATDIRFNCTCSRERTEQALISLGAEELQTLLEEQGRISVSCQFCNQEYQFDPIDVAQLIRGGSGHSPRLH
jgi:molecular chaperone Hsp33